MTTGVNVLAALNSDQIGKIGVGAIIAVVVIGLLLGMIITKLIARLVILVVVVALGAFIWQQRSSIEDHVKDCNLQMSFFGVDVHAPNDVIKHCRQIGQ